MGQAAFAAHKLCRQTEPDPCCHTQHLRSQRSQKTMSGRPTQFASKTGVGTTGFFLCSNASHLLLNQLRRVHPRCLRFGRRVSPGLTQFGLTRISRKTYTKNGGGGGVRMNQPYSVRHSTVVCIQISRVNPQKGQRVNPCDGVTIGIDIYISPYICIHTIYLAAQNLGDPKRVRAPEETGARSGLL